MVFCMEIRWRRSFRALGVSFWHVSLEALGFQPWAGVPNLAEPQNANSSGARRRFLLGETRPSPGFAHRYASCGLQRPQEGNQLVLLSIAQPAIAVGGICGFPTMPQTALLVGE